MAIQTGAAQGIFNAGFNIDQLNTPSFRSAILRMFPNGRAPLFGLTSQTGKVKAKQIEHGFFTKVFEYAAYTPVAAVAAGVATFDVQATQGAEPVPGSILRVPSTSELILVTAVVMNAPLPGQPPVANLTVTRGFGRVATGPIAATDVLQSVGSSHAQASTRPTARSLLTTHISNYTQIFRNAWAVADTARASYTEAGYGNVGENRRDCMLLHSTDMESALFFGQKSLRTANGQIHSTTQGILDSIIQYTDVGFLYADQINSPAPTISPNVTNQAGLPMNYDGFVTAVEPMFKYDTDMGMGKERVGFCGATALRTLNIMGRLSGVVEIYPDQTSFGLAFSRIKTYKGTINLIEHPMFNSLPGLSDTIVFVDLPAVKLAYLEGRDARREDYGNGQNQLNGVDAVGGSLTSEFAVELVNPHSCGIITGLSAAI